MEASVSPWPGQRKKKKKLSVKGRAKRGRASSDRGRPELGVFPFDGGFCAALARAKEEGAFSEGKSEAWASVVGPGTVRASCLSLP
jgi:hypothetical protein